MLDIVGVNSDKTRAFTMCSYNTSHHLILSSHVFRTCSTDYIFFPENI
jgi:hypothetical protein